MTKRTMGQGTGPLWTRWDHVDNQPLWYMPNASKHPHSGFPTGKGMCGWYGNAELRILFWMGCGVGWLRQAISPGEMQIHNKKHPMPPLWGFQFFDTLESFTVGPCKDIEEAKVLVEQAIGYVPGYYHDDNMVKFNSPLNDGRLVIVGGFPYYPDKCSECEEKAVFYYTYDEPDLFPPRTYRAGLCDTCQMPDTRIILRIPSNWEEMMPMEDDDDC